MQRVVSPAALFGVLAASLPLNRPDPYHIPPGNGRRRGCWAMQKKHRDARKRNAKRRVVKKHRNPVRL